MLMYTDQYTAKKMQHFNIILQSLQI